MNDIVDVTAIRRLNDQLRQSLRGGLVVMTAGVRALSEARQLEILTAVANFDRFDADNDPYGEHDLGAVELGPDRLFWKVDYYDQALTNHSPDPADATATKRVPRSTDLRAVRAVRGQPTRLAQVCLADRLFFDQAALDETIR